MSERLQRRFDLLARAGRPGLTPFAVAGDPDAATADLVFDALRRRGGDLIEIGIPAREPNMDGPVIQRAHARAAAAGAGSLDALTQAARLRGRDPDVPLILMGYAAELRSAGPAPYMDAMANAGADGLLIVDTEPAERIPWSQLARDRGIAFIQIVASDAEAESPPGPAWARSGFVYCVASDGPTGGTPPAVAALAARARQGPPSHRVAGGRRVRRADACHGDGCRRLCRRCRDRHRRRRRPGKVARLRPKRPRRCHCGRQRRARSRRRTGQCPAHDTVTSEAVP